MTLDAVGSNPTIYPLKNINNLTFLKQVNFKKIEFNFKYDGYIKDIFDIQRFYSRNIKLLYYFYFFKNSFTYNNYFSKNNYYICLNKKKNHYYLSVIKNEKLFSYITVGTMLKFFNFFKKSLRRSKKGFTTFMNCFKRFFKKYNFENINIIVNFVDYNFIVFRKYFFKDIFLNNFFFFNFNISYSKFKYKKYKNIKRRLKKKFFKKYTL